MSEARGDYRTPQQITTAGALVGRVWDAVEGAVEPSGLLLTLLAVARHIGHAEGAGATENGWTAIPTPLVARSTGLTDAACRGWLRWLVVNGYLVKTHLRAPDEGGWGTPAYALGPRLK